MADELTTTTITPPSTPAAAPSSTPSVPEDYDQLKAFYNTYSPAVPTIQRIAERWDDVAPFVEDGNEEAEFLRKARASYKRERESAAPQLTPELKLVRDEFESKLSPIVDYVQAERQARERAQQYEQQQSFEMNRSYGERLIAERPDLLENKARKLKMIINAASDERVSLETAWKSVAQDFPAPQPKAAPPPSMRGGVAAPGVPGESSAKPISSRTDLRQRLSANLRAAGMKG